jgi:hypothetical protein
MIDRPAPLLPRAPPWLKHWPSRVGASSGLVSLDASVADRARVIAGDFSRSTLVARNKAAIQAAQRRFVVHFDIHSCWHEMRQPVRSYFAEIVAEILAGSSAERRRAWISHADLMADHMTGLLTKSLKLYVNCSAYRARPSWESYWKNKKPCQVVGKLLMPRARLHVRCIEPGALITPGPVDKVTYQTN